MDIEKGQRSEDKKQAVRSYIIVQIEQIVLEGITLTPHQRPLVQAAIELELARLLRGGDIAAQWQTGGAINSVSGGSFTLTSDPDPVGLGKQVAQAVYEGINI